MKISERFIIKWLQMALSSEKARKIAKDESARRLIHEMERILDPTGKSCTHHSPVYPTSTSCKGSPGPEGIRTGSSPD